MPTHCFNVGAILQINMLFVNAGAMLKINTDTQTHCSYVGAMLQIYMLLAELPGFARDSPT